MLRSSALVPAAIFMVACSDSNSRSSVPNAGAGEKINMIQLDTAARASSPVPAPASPSTQPSPAAARPLRDSASGPKMEIDSKGNVSPIKR